MHRLLVVLLLLTGCAQTVTGVPEPDRPGRALLAHDRDSGRLLWRKEVDPVAATEPLLVDGVALVPGEELVAYDARTGERLWTVAQQVLLPQAAGDVAVLPLPGALQGVDPRTGRSLWRTELAADARVFAGPGGVVVIDVAASTVQLLAPDGAQRFLVPVPGQPAYAHPGADVVAVAGLRGDVIALAPDGARELWRAPSPPASQVVVAGDRVVAQLESGLLGLDARTGQQVWRVATRGSRVPLQVVDGRVLAPAFDDPAVLLALDSGRVLGEPPGAWDLELTRQGLVRAEPDALHGETPGGGWQTTVSTGDRPVLWTDADDRVVVGVAGWGQPPTRD